MMPLDLLPRPRVQPEDALRRSDRQLNAWTAKPSTLRQMPRHNVFQV